MVSGIFNNSGAPPAWNSADWKAAPGCEWNLDNGKTARFLRFGDKFLSESVVNGKITREPFEQQQGEAPLSPDEIVAEISKRQPYINEDGTVDFLIKATAKSSLNDVNISESNWGVTVVDLGESGFNLCDPKSTLSWGGHAVVVIETIEDGAYQMKKGDILLSKKPPVAVVRFQENISFDDLRRKGNGLLPKNFPRTQTWVRTKNLVQKMLAQMKLEMDAFSNGHPIIFFDPIGKEGSSLFKSPGDLLHSYNCIQWAEKSLYLANIILPYRFSAGIIQTPALYTGSSVKTALNETGAVLGCITANCFVTTPIGLAIGGPIGGLTAIIVTASATAVFASLAYIFGSFNKKGK